jgi:outer membrane protein TolC
LTADQLDVQAAIACAMPTWEELTKRALEQRPELRSATLQLDAANQSIKAARSGLMPRFDTIVSVGRINAAQEQVAAANESLRLASERYRLQLNTIVELTDAEVAVTKARTQLVNATYDLELARAELDWATGETYRKYARVVKR